MRPMLDFLLQQNKMSNLRGFVSDSLLIAKLPRSEMLLSPSAERGGFHVSPAGRLAAVRGSAPAGASRGAGGRTGGRGRVRSRRCLKEPFGM